MAKRPTDNAARTPDRVRTSATPPADSSQPSRERGDDATRSERIAVAAYYRAERRNFQSDGELDDWLEAEREVDSAAAAGGAQGEASRLAEGPSDVSAPAIAEATGKDSDDYIAPADVQRWAAQLTVSAGTLRVAIERAGARVSDVKRYIDEHALR